MMLRDGDPQVDIVDDGWVDLPAFYPSTGGRASEDNRIFIGQTPLPAAKG
jgi:hypothetical protein